MGCRRTPRCSRPAGAEADDFNYQNEEPRDHTPVRQNEIHRLNQDREGGDAVATNCRVKYRHFNNGPPVDASHSVPHGPLLRQVLPCVRASIQTFFDSISPAWRKCSTLILSLRPIGPWQRSQVEGTAYRLSRLNFGQGPEKVLSYPKRLTNRSTLS
jgi:hypothetical protein